MTRDLWLVVLGSALAFIGGIAAFFIQTWWTLRTRRKLIVEFLLDLLGAYERLAPRIAETHEKSGTLWNDLINLAVSDHTLYSRNQENLVLLRDDTLRVEVREWFSKLGTVLSASLALNNIIQTQPDHQEWAREEIRKQVDQLKALKSEAQTLRSKLVQAS